jgi:hypothetical protein
VSLTAATLLKQAWVPETFRHMRHSWTLLSNYLKEANIKPTDFIDNGYVKDNFEAEMAHKFKRNVWLPLCSHVTTLFDIFQHNSTRRTELIRRVVKRREPGK